MPKDRDQIINQMTDDVDRLMRRVKELEYQLADALKGKMPEMEHLDPSCLYVESIVASTPDRYAPRVNLRWFTHFAQIDEAAARQLAFNILEACEASLVDAFLVSFGKKSGLQPHQAANLLYDFRVHREQFKNQMMQQEVSHG